MNRPITINDKERPPFGYIITKVVVDKITMEKYKLLAHTSIDVPNAMDIFVDSKSKPIGVVTLKATPEVIAQASKMLDNLIADFEVDNNRIHKLIKFEEVKG